MPRKELDLTTDVVNNRFIRMDPYRTHGAISWPELLTPDPDGAVEFYRSVFGWSIEAMPMEGGVYQVASAGGQPRAGIMMRPSDDIPPVWMFYVTVDDLDAAIARVQELGGRIEVPAMEAGGIGRFAGIMDPQGAMLMLMQYAENPDGASMAPVDFLSSFTTDGAFSWFQLLTPDPAASAAFHAELFGWTTEEQQQPMGPYHVVKIGDIGFGGITAPFSPGMPPHWQGYVTVDDADSVADRIDKAGGTLLMPPTDVPGVGRMVALQDPAGAMVMAVAYAVPEEAEDR